MKDQALDDYNRAAKLYNRGDLPKQEYMRASFRQEQAAAEYKAASRQLAEIHLYAPDDGLVVC
jgi:multidrug resistance efflux pump